MFNRNINKFFAFLKKKDASDSKILFLTTSNRWEGDNEMPKSSQLANKIKEKLVNCEVIDVSKLKIWPCEGNASKNSGNNCGVKEAILKNDKKNPHKIIRCWASINNKDDEMYVIANKIYEADIIIFFGSVRWGKMNSIYSKLMERLTWIESRHVTLGESNILKNKSAGIICLGHNWNGQNVLDLEKDVLRFFGFNVPKELSFNYQWTFDSNDESLRGYKKDHTEFLKEISVLDKIKESITDFGLWLDRII